MALKYFTNCFKHNGGSTSIAINPDHVVTVFEAKGTLIGETEEKLLTSIYGVTGQTWQVEEDMLTVVARLNERD